MSVSSGHDSNFKDKPATDYPVVGNNSCETLLERDAARSVAPDVSTVSASPHRSDAAPIRWGWWAAGLGVSAALWASIVMGVF